MRAGPEGQQAWRDLQGRVISDIKKAGLKNMQRDDLGNEVPSPAAIHNAISQLDQSGKLDNIFGKKNAELLRTLDEVAQDILVAPRDLVNWSNTATMIGEMTSSMALFITTGIPVPPGIITLSKVLLDRSKKRKTRKRVKEAIAPFNPQETR